MPFFSRKKKAQKKLINHKLRNLNFYRYSMEGYTNMIECNRMINIDN